MLAQGLFILGRWGMSEKDPLSLFISEPFFCSHIFGETGPKRTIFRQRSSVDLTFPTMNKPCACVEERDAVSYADDR